MKMEKRPKGDKEGLKLLSCKKKKKVLTNDGCDCETSLFFFYLIVKGNSILHNSFFAAIKK